MNRDALIPLIVGSVVTLISAFGAAYWQVRVARAIANPNKNQSQPRSMFSAASFKNTVVVFALCLVSISCTTFAVYIEVLKQSPVTRMSVLLIAFLVGVILLNIISFFLFFMLNAIEDARVQSVRNAQTGNQQ